MVYKKVATLLYALLLCLLNTAFCCAQEPYCGIYSLYAAATSLGIRPNIERLLDEKFVGSRAGSSSAELVEAARSIGLHATVFDGLGKSSLLSMADPLILHVTPRGTMGRYNHWLCVVGAKVDGTLKVIDGPGGPIECAIEDILARWDGVAIAVHKDRKPKRDYANVECVSFLLRASVALLASMLVRLIELGRGQSKLKLVVIAILMISALDSLLVGTNRIATYRAHYAQFCLTNRVGVSEITKRKLAELVEQKLVNLVDARYASDFRLGSIPGAINLPIDMGWGDFRLATANLDRNTMTVVFCKSSLCHFSDYIAYMLIEDGFVNVAIFRGGINEWKS